MEPTDINNVRRNKELVRNAKRFFPTLTALENATADEKRERLFSAACVAKQMFDEGIGTKRSHYWVLRGAASVSGFDLPPEEVEKIIAAAFFRAKPKPTG
jgi:hypothetical protein